MKTICRQFTTTFGAGQSGSVQSAFASFELPSGYYKVELWVEGSGADQSFSVDQVYSDYYQYYSASAEPAVFALFHPNAGVLSFTTTATSNNASTAHGVIFVTPVKMV